ncbi:hypothetical protein C8039_03660 [Halogeometricum sp. wsp3]|nr:hypothetical protein C8039_03660 [Halogeometricum sp. wsp3]
MNHLIRRRLVPTDGSDGAERQSIRCRHSQRHRRAVHLVSVVDTRSLGIDVESTVIVDELERSRRMPSRMAPINSLRWESNRWTE